MVIIGRTKEEIIALQDAIIHFISLPEICYKAQKVRGDPSSGNRISGNETQFKEYDYFLSQKELQSVKQMC